MQRRRAPSYHTCMKTDGKIVQISYQLTSVHENISFHARQLCSLFIPMLMSVFFSFVQKTAYTSIPVQKKKSARDANVLVWTWNIENNVFFFFFLCPSERVQKNDVCTMVWTRLCCLFSKSSQSMRWKACPLPAFYRKRALVLYVEAVATHFQHTTLLNESFISPINKAHVPFRMESSSSGSAQCMLGLCRETTASIQTGGVLLYRLLRMWQLSKKKKKEL